jgi:uncharacterized OB-fold protein
MTYTLPQLKCRFCGHTWVPRKPNVPYCPKCSKCQICGLTRVGCERKGGHK